MSTAISPYIALAQEQLRPDVRRIDQEGYYPEPFLRALGAAGAYRAPAERLEGLAEAVRITTEIGRTCGSTSFLLWCHYTCVWYLALTDNAALRERYLPDVAAGRIMGGTAFSNPMKHYCGLEDLRLKARRVSGGYIVNGGLPWVSNLGVGHLFGTVIDAGEERVAALVRIDGEQVRIGPSGKFAALEGTATYSLKFEEAFISDDDLLGRPAEPFVDKIRPGFLLLQAGIGFGVVRGALDDMARANRKLGEINRFIEGQPEALAEELAGLEAEAERLCATPLDPSEHYQRAVLELRLASADIAHRAGYSALQHAGAPGFLMDSHPQRHMREGLFMTLLTPSVKQLRKTLGVCTAQSCASV